MEIAHFLPLEGVIPNLEATSKKQTLQELAARAHVISELHERTIFDVLLERERLGSTGVGKGIAIPHGKFAGLERLHGMFARLETPIDFEAIDDRRVDLIFLLLAPENAGADHLKALARISRVLRDASVCEKLRHSESAEAIYALLTEIPATREAQSSATVS
ncbi:MAG: PTS IIA-like nitrogen regulatory protein PtsN [Alphaproteobacteria bacterium]